MEIQKNFKELLELLNSHRVKFLVVGEAIGRKKDEADIESLDD